MAQLGQDFPQWALGMVRSSHGRSLRRRFPGPAKAQLIPSNRECANWRRRVGLQNLRVGTSTRSGPFMYLLAVGVTVLAVAVRWVLDPVLGDEYPLVTLHVGIDEHRYGWVPSGS
jgi:hypothetical protein